MKKCLIVLAVAMAAAPAMAAMEVYVNYAPGDYTTYGTGGPFVATVKAGSDPILTHAAGSSFLTFCLERDEYFTPGAWYIVGLSSAANAGGVGGPSPDPLSNAAANLYLEYLSLDTATKKAQGSAYQEAIWWLEEELGGAAPALAAYATGLWGTGDYTGNSVRVMNLTDASGTLRQDMLVAVPAPGAALLAFLGLGIVGWVKRRMA